VSFKICDALNLAFCPVTISMYGTIDAFMHYSNHF
jgi:hypothetical protein